MSQSPESITDQITQPANQQWCYSKHYSVKSYNWEAFVDHLKTRSFPNYLDMAFDR